MTVLGVHPDYFYECFDKFLNYDSAHALYSPAFSCFKTVPDDADVAPSGRKACGAVDPPHRRVYRNAKGQMDFSEAQIWASGINDEEGWVDMIDSVRSKLNAAEKDTGVQVYPTGSLFKFYTQFRWLNGALAHLILYALLGVFGIVSFLFVCIQPPRPEFRTPLRRFAAALYSGLLLGLVVFVIVLALLALMGLAGLVLNCFTAVTLVVAVGISVEFTAHFLHHYLLHSGDRVARTTETMTLVLPPVIDGSLTTLLGILPIAAAKYSYIVIYYFFMYLIIVCVGVAFGLVFLPALLSSVGWQDSMTSLDGPKQAVPASSPLPKISAKPDPRDQL